MSSNSKFLFDTEFGSATPLHKKAAAAPEAPPLLYTDEDKERMCTEAFQSGHAEGRQEALIGVEASSSEVLNTIGGQLQQMAQTHRNQLENIRCEAASLALAIAKKLAPALISRQPEAEILNMVEECLVDLHDEPRIVLRASETVCDDLSEKIDKLATANGFQGNVILLPDDTKTNGDCRIEWADGGVEREISDTTKKVEEIINRFIRSSGDLGEH
ncbi:hypothetical protein A9Q83_16705 [Alphaproteobacteria bacterium 46_93_T64]|mgnify:CR=1 FL=1|nr:hypothetical protein A9Q83_16705 [Alphaproteobacteria bacterium 46_93_T64]